MEENRNKQQKLEIFFLLLINLRGIGVVLLSGYIAQWWSLYF